MTTSTPVAEPEWLSKRRNQGKELTSQLGLPTSKTPGWEFTDIRGVDPDSYKPAESGDPGAIDRTDPLIRPDGSAIRLRQVDSAVIDELDGKPADGEAVVMPLSQAAQLYPELVEKHIGSVVPTDDPFVARNESAWQGGAFIFVPSGVKLERPVVVEAVQNRPSTALHWRTLIVLEENAEAEVWEQRLTCGDDLEALFNGVVELKLGAGSKLTYVTAQDLSKSSYIFSSERAEVGRDALLEWVTLGFGSSKGKVKMETCLQGTGSNARVTGAYVGNGKQHIDFDTLQEHAAESTFSDLAFRGVLDGKATAVWRGMIQVDEGAQKTDAFQDSRNLLLSNKAHADAIPGLEIQADDVRCTHAAAVAQVDREQLFYLQSRGVSKEDAEQLVVEGFLEELVMRFEEGSNLRKTLAGTLERRVIEMLNS